MRIVLAARIACCATAAAATLTAGGGMTRNIRYLLNAFVLLLIGAHGGYRFAKERVRARARRRAGHRRHRRRDLVFRAVARRSGLGVVPPCR